MFPMRDTDEGCFRANIIEVQTWKKLCHWNFNYLLNYNLFLELSHYRKVWTRSVVWEKSLHLPTDSCIKNYWYIYLLTYLFIFLREIKIKSSVVLLNFSEKHRRSWLPGPCLHDEPFDILVDVVVWMRITSISSYVWIFAP